MRLFEYDKSNFEQIKLYYQVWYWEVLEMVAIWSVMGKCLDDIRAGIIRLVDNSIVSTADAETLTRLEDFLYISYDGSRTLEERRAIILSFFTSSGHIGRKEIEEIIRAFVSGEISVELIGGTIYITLTREYAELYNLSDCLYIINRRIPAHLALMFEDITETEMPSKEFRITGYLGRGYTETRLPEYEPSHGFNTIERVSAVTHTISTTKMPESEESP